MSGARVVVVGAAGALGQAVVRAFVAQGASVRGLDRAVPDEVPAGADHDTTDVLDDAALRVSFDAEPPPWAVINVVGGFAPHRPLTELDPDELMSQLRLNLLSAALITKHALRRFGETGEGRLVHTASRVAYRTEGAGFAYSISKLGVVHLVEMAAREVHGSAITVNAVVPSIIDTPANRAAMPNSDLARWPKADEVAAAYVWLASREASLVSGTAVPVYGRS